MKRKLKTLLALCLCMSVLFPTLQVAAAETPGISVSNAVSGNEVTVTVAMNSKVEDVVGLQLRLDYNQGLLSYSSGSRKIQIQSSNLMTNKDNGKDGRINFLVDSPKEFDLSGKIASFQFRAIGDQDSEITVEVLHLYRKVGGIFEEIALEEATAKTTVKLSPTTSGAAQKVIDAIGAIGEVSLDKEAQIQDARKAYNALKTTDKQKVTNLDVLADAEKLLNQMKQAEQQAAYKKQAETFRETHSEILGKTTQTVAISDKSLLQQALDDYAEQHVNVRIELINDKNLLNKLQNRIKELEEIEEGKITEALLRKEAEQMVAEFREKYASILAMKEDEVTDQETVILVQAVGEAEAKDIENSYFLETLGSDYEKLKTMLSNAEKYLPETESSDALQAMKFLSSFGYLLNMKPEDVTEYELVDIKTALALYDMLSSEAQKMVGENAREQLSSLLAAGEGSIGTGGTPSGEIEKEIVYVEKVTEGVSDIKKALINLVSQKTSPLLLWLTISAGSLWLLALIEFVMLLLLRRKEKNEEKGGALYVAG